MKHNDTFANKYTFDPENKICVVTGGSSGIGLALIKELLNRKAKKVINIDIIKNSLDAVDFYNCDVGNNQDIKTVLNDIYQKFTNIDLFCCNAGVATDDDGWEKIPDYLLTEADEDDGNRGSNSRLGDAFDDAWDAQMASAKLTAGYENPGSGSDSASGSESNSCSGSDTGQKNTHQNKDFGTSELKK